MTRFILDLRGDFLAFSKTILEEEEDDSKFNDSFKLRGNEEGAHQRLWQQLASEDSQRLLLPGGSVVGSVPCVRNVAGLNPTLAAT